MNLRHAYVTCMLRARHVRTTRVSCARHVHIMYASCACHVRACARVRACVRACVVGGCALARDRSMPWMVSEFVRRADDSSLRPNRATARLARRAFGSPGSPVRVVRSGMRSDLSLLSFPSRVLLARRRCRSRDRGLVVEGELLPRLTRRNHGGYAAAVPSPRRAPHNERRTHARTSASLKSSSAALASSACCFAVVLRQRPTRSPIEKNHGRIRSPGAFSTSTRDERNEATEKRGDGEMRGETRGDGDMVGWRNERRNERRRRHGGMAGAVRSRGDSAALPEFESPPVPSLVRLCDPINPHRETCRPACGLLLLRLVRLESQARDRARARMMPARRCCCAKESHRRRNA